jgi:ABC-type transporter Mla subunit MlaD
MAVVLLLSAGAAAMAGLSGCVSNTGFFAQSQQSYTVNVTGASGTLSHTSNVTLTVE